MSDSEIVTRKNAREKALKAFYYETKDIKNKDKFNEVEITKRYHKLAMIAHPDERDGT